MNDTTTKPSDDEIDDYITPLYLNPDADGYTAELIRRAREMRDAGHGGAADIIEASIRAMAAWEMQQA